MRTRNRLPAIWRNLVLLYLGTFLLMAAWGIAGTAAAQRSLPALVQPESNPGRIPSLQDILGIWPPGRELWRRLLQLAILGLAGHAGKLM